MQTSHYQSWLYSPCQQCLPAGWNMISGTCKNCSRFELVEADTELKTRLHLYRCSQKWLLIQQVALAASPPSSQAWLCCLDHLMATNSYLLTNLETSHRQSETWSPQYPSNRRSNRFEWAIFFQKLAAGNKQAYHLYNQNFMIFRLQFKFPYTRCSKTRVYQP